MRKSNIVVALMAGALLATGGAVAVDAAAAPTPPAADPSALVPTGVRHLTPVQPQATGLRPGTRMPNTHVPVHVDPLIAGCVPGYGDPGSQCIPVKTKVKVTCAWLTANGYLTKPLVVNNKNDPLGLDPRHNGKACS